jgi:hypothetical protein
VARPLAKAAQVVKGKSLPHEAGALPNRPDIARLRGAGV